MKSGLLSADDLNAIRNHFGLDSRSFKGVEGSARNDGVGGNGDGGVGNGDAAEASAESPVKAAKGGGNQGATISPDGDKQRDEQRYYGAQQQLAKRTQSLQGRSAEAEHESSSLGERAGSR